jgi:hypothetical protein
VMAVSNPAESAQAIVRSVAKTAVDNARIRRIFFI